MSKYAELKKRYDSMENVLQYISQRSIALEDEAKKRNNAILKEVTDMVIGKIKEKNQLFRKLYTETFYGGSFYDNLKVGCPDEFDLDLILNMPDVTKPIIWCSDHSGFVYVRLTELSTLAPKEPHEDLKVLLDDTSFLATNKLLCWFEGLITSALNGLPRDAHARTYLDVIRNRSHPDDILRLYIEARKSGPAFTLHLYGKDDSNTDIKLDIDLVPCFKFNETQWSNKYKKFSAKKYKSKTFLVVAKKLKETGSVNTLTINRYWRLSLQEQERELISGNDFQFLKPALRLLKKLRDNDNHKIASYFIKTVFLWKVEKEDSSFWSTSLSVVFMCMLKMYQEYLENKEIPYFWNSNYNLIACLKPCTVTDIANRFQRIINAVEKSVIEDPYLIGKYLLSKEDYATLPTSVPIGKKHGKRKQNTECVNALMTRLSLNDTTDSAPLEQLGFDSETREHYRYLSDRLEEKNKENMQSIMRSLNQQAIDLHDLSLSLKKVDRKMDAILKNHEETNKELAVMNERVSVLEDRFKVTLFNINLPGINDILENLTNHP
ncbi:hypothetical protein HUJ04_003766 [Dendroctonus ponderosae]|uniref:Mab-21-like nucleotidyltransferase domain-containing protein n=2 Tax=Dendroctonus ponderosae TaxID=77166 RepID=A0AAR5Q638_DENPD|nr:hypothetical protein HUJ04_003766 [Dendroctonus ponderosae]